MSMTNPATEPAGSSISNPAQATIPASYGPNNKPPRVLSCVACQQRKIRCDRQFPCAGCVRSNVTCVPGNVIGPRPRRRRFPERELLVRLRHYEHLLRENRIRFEPLHPGAESTADGGEDDRGRTEPGGPGGKPPADSGNAVDLWQAISQVTLGAEDEEGLDGYTEYAGDEDEWGLSSETPATSSHHADPPLLLRYGMAVDRNNTDTSTLKVPFNSGAFVDDQLLFEPPVMVFDLSAAHPPQAQMFRLWQIYLDNVNPLLKVTHTPSMQSRIIDAASDIASISDELEALLFSIYCVAVMSLNEDECLALFLVPRRDLLAAYHASCQQALLKCSVWRSNSVDALTAFFLYLISVFPQTDTRCLSCMLTVTIHVAQRIGMHCETYSDGCTVLEAEMRRRLWWSLVNLDFRVCELTDLKVTTLVPTWDCRVPLNVNDFELRPDMKHAPAAHDKPSEALFAVVRSELADVVRHSAVHLNYVNPALKVLAQSSRHGLVSEDSELASRAAAIEKRYLAGDNDDDDDDDSDALHYMTVWTSRASVARSSLLAHYSRHSTSSTPETPAQRAAAVALALRMLDADTRLRMSSRTRGFGWFLGFYRPALAYLYVLNDLRRWPAAAHADAAWRAIGDNYAALTMTAAGGRRGEDPVYVDKFAQVVLLAWEARVSLCREQGRPPETPVPALVADVRDRLARTGGGVEQVAAAPPVIPLVPDEGLAASMDGGAMDQFWTDIDWR